MTLVGHHLLSEWCHGEVSLMDRRQTSSSKWFGASSGSALVVVTGVLPGA